MLEPFPGFATERVKTSGAEIHLRRGGRGPAVLLLHGFPQTHLAWWKVAPGLAQRFSVVVPDLRGYGASSKPDGGPDHAGYAKRTMAQDMVETMAALGHTSFAVVGHDRGARVAYRLALDHAARVTKLAVFDIVPTYVMWTRMNRRLASQAYHWVFLSQPADLPERLIAGDPGYFVHDCIKRWTPRPDRLEPAVVDAYIRSFSAPDAIHAACEDYRAGATLDFAHDEADFGKRKISCPTLALWGESGYGKRSSDALDVWREWADDVSGHALPCGHFVPEEAPEATLTALEKFL
jgi:haloacetate dehalogenase